MKMLLALAASALGYCYYCGRNARTVKSSRKEELQRWEGEGGNVPAVATPTPAPIPRTSFPATDPGLRH
jgi:hypothetical protein